MDIGKIIKLARIKRGWTQEELANVLGITKVAVSGWEKGKRIPSGDLLIKVTIELDIVNELFPGYTQPQQNEIDKLWQAIEQLSKKVEKIEIKTKT